jgi:hypothetical protein
MANLAAADVTIVISEVRLMGRLRKVRGTIQFGDGVKTYPVGGVPLPTFANFGFYRAMNEFYLIGNPGGNANNFVPEWDGTNNKLQMYAETTVATNQPLIELTNAATPASQTFQFEAWGW